MFNYVLIYKIALCFLDKEYFTKSSFVNELNVCVWFTKKHTNTQIHKKVQEGRSTWPGTTSKTLYLKCEQKSVVFVDRHGFRDAPSCPPLPVLDILFLRLT